MIRCPKCGTMNRDNNRFCKQCNTRLPQTSILCPECGAANPVGNVLCDKCNARLITATESLPPTSKLSDDAIGGIKGISLPTLPTSKNGAPESAELPDWLLELTDEGLNEPVVPDTAEEPGREDVPDWLSGLLDQSVESIEDSARESVPVEPLAPDMLPDWLTGMDVDTAAPTAETPSDEALPDWFSGLLDDEPEETEAQATTELPEWFSGLEDASPVIPASDEAESGLPDWMMDLSEETAPETASTFEAEEAVTETSIEEDALPDWLSGLSDDIERAGTPSPQRFEQISEDALPSVTEPDAAELPDWLSGFSDQGPVEHQDAGQLPSWLQEEDELSPLVEGDEPQDLPSWLSAVTPVSSPPPVKPGDRQADSRVEAFPDVNLENIPESTQDESPDWLSGVLFEPEESPDLLSVTPSDEEEALPDWLSGITSPDFEQTEAPVPEPELPAIPNWLSSVFTEEPDLSIVPSEPSAEEEVLPDWLAGILEEQPETDLPQETPNITEDIAEAVPDWLRGQEEMEAAFTEETPVRETPAPAERPAWLSDLDVTTTTEPEEAESPVEKPLPTAKALPDWLKDVPASSDELTPKPAAPAFISEGADVEEEAENEGFLLGEASSAPVERAAEAAAMPDWLRDLEPGEEEEEQLFVEEELATEEDNLARAEVPAWLQNLRPPGTGPLPPLPDMAEGAATSAEEVGLARAEIPDWLQHLRPSPAAEGQPSLSTPVTQELVEETGPLAHLPGVLPPDLIVDMPSEFVAAPRPAIPESIVAQAQLWQQLLERPRSVERPVAQIRSRSGSGAFVMRLLTAIFLFAAVVLGVGLSKSRLSQALSAPHIEDLSRAIDALQPGDTVVVAVEYGPAEAGEMQPMAEALMAHLADREVQVMALSTLPEGVGLAQGLLNTALISDELSMEPSTYLAGASNGIALFLSESPVNMDMLVVVSARPERLRWWIEQSRATDLTGGSSARPVPVTVGVSASTGAMMSPYLASAPVTGWLAGFPDVVAYHEFRGLTDELLTRELDALMLTHWVALALLICGFCYYLIAGRKGNA